MSEMRLEAAEPARKKKKFLYLKMPKGYDHIIHLCTILLAGYGLMMIASASMGQAVGNNRYIYMTAAKQFVFIVIGYLVMTNTANHFRLKSLSSSRFPLLLIAMAAVLVSTRLFSSAGGANAWIRFHIGSMEMTIQPSEFAKICSFLCVAAYCGDVKRQNLRGFDIVKKPLLIIFIYIIIVLGVENDLGSAAVIAFISFICFFIPKHPALKKFRIFLYLVAFVIIAAVLFFFSPAFTPLIESFPDKILKTYQKNRFLSAKDPFSDPYGSSYQLIYGLTSFASGGWFGSGLGNSVHKYMNFPAANTDYILAITVDELGYIGFLALMALYGIIIFRLIAHARSIRSEKAQIILVGTAMYFLIHIVLNVGGVTGLIPLTGVPLLMMSYGGTSLVSIMCALGLCQAVISTYERKGRRK